jgi:tyrosinase
MPISRRRVVEAGITAGLAGGFLSFPASVVFAESRTRFSATSAQGKAMLAKYATAVGAMMDAGIYPTSDARSWNSQWYTHWVPPAIAWDQALAAKTKLVDTAFTGKPPDDPARLLAEAMWNSCQSHGRNPADPLFFQRTFFCVWHRYFVYYFENIVRAVLKDDTFTLPYWDYLAGSVDDLKIPEEFRDPSSPLYRADRNDWVNKGERIDRNNPGTLNLNALAEPDYIDAPNGAVGFCPLLDSNPHGLVHSYVGTPTNMGRVPFAASDPVFWVHHCNIDRLWETWSRMPGKTPPTWPDRHFAFADGAAKAVDVVASGAARTADLKYEYATYARTAGPVATSSRRRSPSGQVTRASASRPVTLGSERVRNALVTADLPIATAPRGGAKPFAASSAASQLYLVLGGVTAPPDAASTYNVFLDLSDAAAQPGPTHPNYVGTLHFFGSSADGGHDGTGHDFAFNVTAKVRALIAQKALDASPNVTFVRHGPAESSPPTVAQMYLVER